MLRVINYGAACCVIIGPNVRILCDPWFTDGIYMGAWEREEYIPDPLTVIGPCEYIWISHLHQDHYDPEFLHKYRTAYPAARIMTGPDSEHLIRMMKRDGLYADHVRGFGNRGWDAWTLPNGGYEIAHDNIDSALIVTDIDSAVVNMNDCPFDQRQVDRINQLTAGKHVTALLPYSGAGPWPQCYRMSSLACLAAADDKKKTYVTQFARYKYELRADVAVPFSAGYSLCGPLAELNPYRGIPKPQDVPGATVLPVTGAQKRPAAKPSAYAWESLPQPTNQDLERLLLQAHNRSPKVDGAPLTIDLNWGASSSYVDATYAPALRAHETIEMDSRLLFGLLTKRFHWNNAEIGVGIKITRHGEQYDPRVFSYLYRFHI